MRILSLMVVSIFSLAINKVDAQSAAAASQGIAPVELQPSASPIQMHDSLKNSPVYYIKVHFLYGSRPLQKYKGSEKKWFGGVLGGHVGIESDSGRIINFRGNGNFHVFQNKRNMHSKFDVHDFDGFYALFGSHPDSVKKVIITIPVTAEQKRMFDSIGNAYIKQTPYDYALFGYRCGAAAYEILGKLGIMKNYSYQRTYMKIFYPQKLRRRLLAAAERNNWSIERQEGTNRRKWEKH